MIISLYLYSGMLKLFSASAVVTATALSSSDWVPSKTRELQLEYWCHRYIPTTGSIKYYLHILKVPVSTARFLHVVGRQPEPEFTIECWLGLGVNLIFIYCNNSWLCLVLTLKTYFTDYISTALKMCFSQCYLLFEPRNLQFFGAPSNFLIVSLSLFERKIKM